MLIIFGLHHYEKCTKNVFLICLVNFQNCDYGFKAYPYTIGYLDNICLQTNIVTIFFFLNSMPKRGEVSKLVLPSSTFQSKGGQLPTAPSPMKWY